MEAEVDFGRIHNVEDVKRLLEEINEREVQLRREAEVIVDEARDWALDHPVTNAVAHADTVAKAVAELAGVGRALDHASRLADGITTNIRSIDLTQRRVDAALRIVADIREMKSSVSVVEESLVSGDLEVAASHVGKFSAPAAGGRRAGAAGTGGRAGAGATGAGGGGEDDEDGGSLLEVDEEGKQMLSEARSSLVGTAKQRLEGALAAEDAAGVVRFACLLAPLGLGDEGYATVKGFLVTFVQSQADRAMRDFERRPKAKQQHLELLQQLYALVQEQLATHAAKLREAFGVQRWVGIVLSVKAQSDAQTIQILDRFQNKEVKPVLAAAAKKDAGGGGGGGEDEHPHQHQQRDALVETLSWVLQHVSAFDRDVRALYVELSAEAGMAPEDMLDNADMERQCDDLGGLYVALETHVLKENVARAVAMDRERMGGSGGGGGGGGSGGAGGGGGGGGGGGSGGMDPDLTVSGVIDDTFFCLQISAARSFRVGSELAAAKVLDAVRTVLSKDLGGVLKSYLDNAVFSLTRDVGAAELGSLVNQDWVVSLNNVETAVAYTGKLCDGLKAYVDQAFGAGAGGAAGNNNVGSNARGDASGIAASSAASSSSSSPSSSGAAGKALEQVRATSEQMRKLSDKYVNKLFQVKEEQLAWAFQFDRLARIEYDLDEDAFTRNDAIDPFASGLCTRMETCLSMGKQDLLPDAFEVVVVALVERLVKKLERIVSKKRFTMLGGLQLDKDVRVVSSFFVDMCHAGIREHFARLRLTATLLAADRLSEAREIYGDGAGQPLSLDEVRDVLSLRVDFDERAVADLSLLGD